MENPTQGDFIKLVEDDFQVIGVPLDISFVKNSSRDAFKSFVKKKVKNAALKYLKQLQQRHTKVNHIKYDELITQNYLTSPLFSNEETKLLYAFRTRTVDTIKANFSNMYFGGLNCPLNCWSEGRLHKKIHNNICCIVQSCNPV